MTDPKKIAADEAADGSKLTSGMEVVRVSHEGRSASDERRFQNAIEDDEVRDALRVMRGTKSTPRNRSRS